MHKRYFRELRSIVWLKSRAMVRARETTIQLLGRSRQADMIRRGNWAQIMYNFFGLHLKNKGELLKRFKQEGDKN